MGLQHLADGNQKKAVKSLSKAIYFCQVNGLKWELVRAADDLQVCLHASPCAWSLHFTDVPVHSPVHSQFHYFVPYFSRAISKRMQRQSHQMSLLRFRPFPSIFANAPALDPSF